MPRNLLLVIILLGLGVVLFLFLPTTTRKPDFVVKDYTPLAFHSGLLKENAPTPFVTAPIDKCIEQITKDLPSENKERMAYALLALSQNEMYTKRGGFHSIMQKLAGAITASTVQEWEQQLVDDPVKTVKLIRLEWMALLRYYQATGQRSVLENGRKRLDFVSNFRNDPKIGSVLAYTSLQPIALQYLLTADRSCFELCNLLIEKGRNHLKQNPGDLSLKETLSFYDGLLMCHRFQDQSNYLLTGEQAWATLKHDTSSQLPLLEWLEFTGHLYQLTGHPKYIDTLEMLLYNQLLGAQAQYEVGNLSPNLPPEAIANGMAQIRSYFSGAKNDHLTINFYEPGTYKTTVLVEGKKQTIKYQVDTNYPASGTVELTILEGPSSSVPVALRVPGWCNQFEVRFQNAFLTGKAGNYLTFSKQWDKGEMIRICLDMRIRQQTEPDAAFYWGPQLLAAPPELQAKPNAPAGWSGRQYYRLTTVNGAENKRWTMIPYATACQFATQSKTGFREWQLIQKEPSDTLEALRRQLVDFRSEFGGGNDLPDVPFFLFGMGNRPKFIYRDGLLKDALTGDTYRSWSISQQTIVPNAYAVKLRSTAGTPVRLYENEVGIFIQEGTQPAVLVEGSAIPLQLPEFSEYQYDQILKVLHHEILVNIVDSKPLPNFLVYDKPWRRDAAMMAMCLEKTGNLDQIKEWVLSLEEPYDYNNKMDGIPEQEADNLGQTLYLLSLFTDQNHPLVAKILEEVPSYEKKWLGVRYIEGRSDFEAHAAYQTKWLKFGLKRMGLDDPYQVPRINEGYNTLFWWDYQDPARENEQVEVWKDYPYISWAKDHYFGTRNSPISNKTYPLTWERNASQANYERIKMVDATYYLDSNASPHTWHAAEVFLYLMEFKK